MKRILEQIIDRNTEGNYLLSSSDKAQMISEILDLFDVVGQSEQYCECDKPTLGESISRCGTCDEWFKPLK